MTTHETVGRPMEILLVEDSLVSARVTMGTLRQGNIQHRMTWLTDGREALDFIFQRGRFSRAPHPDLILLDLGLPGMDGTQILEAMQERDELKRIPVVVLTASTDPDDIEVTERCHVAAYMTKPVDLDKFLFLVKELKEFWHAGVILPAVD